MALVFPDLEHTARETIACDYFIDALAEPDLALKVRERSPNSLDEAFRIALQLEVWRRDVERVRHEPLKGKAREVSKTESSVEGVLKKRVAELQEEVARMKARECSAAEPRKPEKGSETEKNSASKPNTQVTRQEGRPNQAAATSFVCYGAVVSPAMLSENAQIRQLMGSTKPDHQNKYGPSTARYRIPPL